MDDKLTTDNRPIAAEIAAALTSEERGVFMDMRKGYSYISDAMWNRLFALGLIRFPITDFIGLHNVTDLGREVLAVLEATREPAAAGKPATITLKQYCNEGWSLRKDCKISVQGFPASWIERVDPSYENMYFVGFQDHEGPHFMQFYGYDKLDVTWLTAPQPANLQAATAKGSEADDGAIQARALDHVSTQWVQLHQLISEALGLEFLPNEDIERYSEAITALRDQNAALRELCRRAAVAIEKSAHVHVDAWNMLNDLRRAAKEEG